MPLFLSRFRKFPIFLTLVVVALIYFGFVTYFTGLLFREEYRSVSYDSLGKNLLQLETWVDPGAIGWEGMERDGKLYMYYGPFPALIRMIPNILLPDMYGSWPRISCLLAGIFSVLAFISLVSYSLAKNKYVTERSRILFTSILSLLFGLGTPLIFLVSCGRIFHESIIWGVSGALWATYYMTRLIDDSKDSYKKDLLLFGIATSVTMLSRLTFAFPFFIFLPFLFFRDIRRKLSPSQFVLNYLFLIPLAIAGVFQAWYNFDRFGSIFTTADFSKFYVNPKNLGGMLNIRRVPSALYSYFFPHLDHFTSEPPFVQVLRATYLEPSLFMDWREEIYSYFFSSGWLLLFAALGWWSIFKGRGPWLKRAGSWALLFQCALISSYFFITVRYSAEYLPAFVFFTAEYLSVARFSWNIPKVIIAVLLSFFSIITTPIAVLQWNAFYNGDVPREYKREILQHLYEKVSLPENGKTTIPITKLNPIASEGMFSPPQIGKTDSGYPIELRGHTYEDGIGMHAVASIAYKVPPGMNRFESIIGMSDYDFTCDKVSMVFKVLDEKGKMLGISNIFLWKDSPRFFIADLKNAKQVTLKLDRAGDLIDCDHGVWVTPRFVKD